LELEGTHGHQIDLDRKIPGQGGSDSSTQHPTTQRGFLSNTLEEGLLLLTGLDQPHLELRSCGCQNPAGETRSGAEIDQPGDRFEKRQGRKALAIVPLDHFLRGSGSDERMPLIPKPELLIMDEETPDHIFAVPDPGRKVGESTRELLGGYLG
jgi:hypothetical protein